MEIRYLTNRFFIFILVLPILLIAQNQPPVAGADDIGGQINAVTAMIMAGIQPRNCRTITVGSSYRKYNDTGRILIQLPRTNQQGRCGGSRISV